MGMQASDNLNELHASCAALRPPILIAGVFFSTLLPASAAPHAMMSFDSGVFTSSSSSQVDLSRFDKGNILLAGTSRVDVTINQSSLGRQDITFNVLAGEESAVACLDRAKLVQFGVDPDKVARGVASLGEVAVPRELPDGALCGDLGNWIPGAVLSFNSSEQRLSISVPQIYMNISARGYVPSSQWDDGINAALLGYNFSGTRSTGNNGGTQAYLGLNGGINVGEWRLRLQGAQAWNSARGRSPY